MATRLRELLIDRVDLVDKGANPDARIVLFKRDTTVIKEDSPMAEATAEVVDEKKDEEQPDALAQALARIAELEAQATVTKRETAAAFEKRLADAEAKAVAAEAVAKAEREAREKREYIEKGQRYGALPMNPATDWEHLRAIDTLPAAAREFVLKMFNAGDEFGLQKGSVFERAGHSHSTNGSSAWGQIKAEAAALVAKSANGLTQAQAIDQIVRERPELYRQYKEEQ